MSKPILAADVSEFTTRHIAEVFDTMLTMKAAPAANVNPSSFSSRVSGSVGFAGELVTGSLYIHISADFARLIAATMLGLPPEEMTSDTDVNDVIGEVSNMIAGGLKSWLCDAGAKCALTTPAVIRGSSFAILPNAEVQRVSIGFATEAHQGLVEVHLKLKQ
jgi:chemotaxis protein CheX